MRNVLNGIEIAAYYTAKVIELCFNAAAAKIAPEQYQDTYNQQYAKLKAVCTTLRHQLQESSARDMARGVTSIIAETLLTGKLATASLNFFDKARAGLKIATHELAKAPQAIATTAEGINVQESIAQKASDKFFDFMERGRWKNKRF